jgi:type II secretory pathway pseudopilin PulG
MMIRIRRVRHLVSDQSGFTLMEVIVSALLVTLVLAAVAGIYLSTVNTQQTVSGVTGSSNDAQLAARTIDTALRNGSSYEITAGSDGGQLLVVRSAGSDAVLAWHCIAWYFSPLDGGSIRMSREADGTAIAVPSAATLATWTLLAAGVEAPGNIAFSADINDDQLLVVSFATTEDGDGSTTINTASALSPAASEETETCS